MFKKKVYCVQCKWFPGRQNYNMFPWCCYIISTGTRDTPLEKIEYKVYAEPHKHNGKNKCPYYEENHGKKDF